MSSTGAVLACALACGCGRIGFSEVGTDGAGGSTLTLEPSGSTINLGSRQSFVASGGSPPYTFTVAGGGWIDASGMFVAPQRAGTSEVRVVDGDLAEATAEVVYEGARLFLVGGDAAGTPVADVRSSTDGITWSTVGFLPEPRVNGALTVFDDRMFYFGGTGAGAPTDEIIASSDGVTWAVVGRLPTRVTSGAFTVDQTGLWWISGYEGTSDVPGVYHSTDGVAWSEVGALPTPRHEHDVIRRGDELVVFGGHGAVLYDDILTSTDGVTWTTSPVQLGFTTDFQGAGELGPLVVRACGIACGDVEVSSDLVTWTKGPLPGGGRDGPVITGFQGRFVLIGGPGPSLTSTDGLAWSMVTTQPSFTELTRSAIVQFTPP